jgi:hypothetical protein
MSMAEFAASVMDIGDSSPSNNSIIYGPPGGGKTALASELPNNLLLGCDPGWATAKSLGRQKNGCRVRPINEERELIAGIEWLENGAYSEFEYVVLDGSSVLQNKLTLNNARYAWEANPAKRANAWQPDKPDYGQQQNALKSIIARLYDLPVSVIVTCHATLGDDESLETWIRPDWQGREYRLGNFINGLANCIGYLAPGAAQAKVGGKTVTRQVRRLLWKQWRDDEKDTTIMAKDQLNIFPDWMDDPTGQQLHEAFESVGSEPAADSQPEDENVGMLTEAEEQALGARQQPRVKRVARAGSRV